MTNLVTNYNFLFIVMTILVTNKFLFFKLISKLVTIVINNFWSLKLITNGTFSCSGWETCNLGVILNLVGICLFLDGMLLINLIQDSH